MHSLALAVLAIALAAPYAPAQAPGEGRRVVAIEFEGLENKKPDELTGKIQTRVGEPFASRQASADLKRLARMGMVGEVRTAERADGLAVIFSLRENATLGAVRFVGNSSISTSDLEKLIRIRPDDLVTQESVRTAREAVLKEYRRRGYMRVEVRADLAKGGEDGDVLQIFINEGRKIRVEDVEIQGNEFYSDLRLRVELETKGSWMFFDNYFDEAAFERDLTAIRRLYYEAGFFDISVEAGAFRYDEAGQDVSPVIIVEEGPRYKFGPVQVEGNTVFTVEEIEACFAPLVGEYFDGPSYAQAVDKARELYANAGFVTTQVQDRIDKDPENGQVRFTLRFIEKARVRVGRILVERQEPIEGDDPSWFGRIYNSVAPPVDPDTIRREVTLEPGEVYDKRKEQETAERLCRLKVFQRVDVESRSTDDPSTRDVLIKVEEGVTGNVFLGVGFSESFGAYLWGNYTERNFLGKAGDLRVNLLAGTREINGTVSYLDRYLGRSDMSLYTELHAITARRPGYRERNTGVQAELGIPMSETWKTYVRGRLEFVNLDDSGYDPDEDLSGSYPVATVRWRFTNDTLKRDTLENGMRMPVAGHKAGFGVEGGFADGPLLKLTGSIKGYRRVGERLVYVGDLRAGLMPFSADQIGPTERFYMGGTNDLRGFAYRRAGPHDSGDGDVPLGGATKLLARNELHYPLFKHVGGVAFFDIGMLGRGALELDTPRASAGLGLRLSLNNIDAGVDLALPLNAQGDDATRFFHFNLNSMAGF